MADLVYRRVSTDEQSTQRQTYLLGEAGLVDGAEGVRLFSDPATSSKIPALERAGFRDLAGYARPGDRLIVSELFRLCRDLADILALRSWCQQHQVKLRVLGGALSNSLTWPPPTRPPPCWSTSWSPSGSSSATCKTS